MAASQPVPQTTRLAGLDAARIIATFGIVWVHVAEGHDQSPHWTSLGRFGTSFYVIVAALFVVQGVFRTAPRPFSSELQRRARRLLQPYVVWCVIYGAYYGARGYLTGVSWAGLSRWWGPVAGTAVHLWFLPFVFVWGLVAVLLAPRVARLPRSLAVAGGAFGCALLYWYCYRRLHLQLSRPWLWSFHLHRLDRWIVEVPPFLTAVWGAVVVGKWGAPITRFVRSRSSAVAGCAALGFALVQFSYGHNVDAIKRATLSDGRFMANIAALLLLVGVLAIQKTKVIEKVAPWGRFTYLAFLVHMLLIEILRHPVKSMPGYGSLWFSLVESVLIFAGSLMVSRIIAKTSWLAPLRA